MDQHKQLSSTIQTLPRERLERYSVSLPRKIREFYLENLAEIKFVNSYPKLEDYNLPINYRDVDKRDEATIEKTIYLVLIVLFVCGYIACAIYFRKNGLSIILSLLAPVLSYGWFYLIFVEVFLSTPLNNLQEKLSSNTPLKKHIKEYEDAVNSYLFWNHIDFCYSAETESMKKLRSDYRYKMNFIEAHKIVSEYIDLFADGKVSAYGFPASDLSFYGLNWEDLLFDAAKIWASHAIIYDERTDNEMQRFASLLISYGLGLTREEYEYNQAQYRLFEITNGKEGTLPIVDAFSDCDKYADYKEFISSTYEYKQRLIDNGINLKAIPYEVLRDLCVYVYSHTGIVLLGEDIAFFSSFEHMRLDLMLNKNSVYNSYRQYITKYT